jgi:hypothetical protein
MRYLFQIINASPTTSNLGQAHQTYLCEGGHQSEEAIEMLRAFYTRGNVHAPPNKRRKKGESAAPSQSSAPQKSEAEVPSGGSSSAPAPKNDPQAS